MRLFFLCFLLLSWLFGYGQTRIEGVVLDEDREPLPFANVRIQELRTGVPSNENGLFSVSLPASAPDSLSFAVSYVGKRKLEQSVKIRPNKVNSVELILAENNLYLSEVEIDAQRIHTTNSNSSIVIEQSAIEQIQPYSLADILSNLLPGQTITNPMLQSAQSINLRSVATGKHAQNSQFGTAIIVDGEALSNNMNLQGSGNGFGLNEQFNAGNYGSSDFTFSSTDLRQIPANNIEKIEVIQGVASAKYGDMTDGAILIDRKAGVSPWNVSARIQNGTSNFGLSKGFKLSPRLGSISTSLDYLNAAPSTTNRLKSYKRISTSLLWTFYPDKEKNISSNLGFDFSSNLDDYKADTERDNEKVKNDHTQLRLNYRGSWKVALPFLDQLNYRASYSVTRQFSYQSRYLNLGVRSMAISTKEGVSEGIFTHPNYQAETKVYGRPERLSFSLSGSQEILRAENVHEISFGANFSHERNRGQGYEVDPYTPRWSTGSLRSQSRDFNFEVVPPLANLGLYIEDIYSGQLFGKVLKASAGIRLDRQFRRWSFSPRLSSSLELNEHMTINAAYGIATKSPGLVHLQPKPVYFDYRLMSYYPNNYEENLVLYYTEIITPDNSQLQPMRSQNLELGISYRKRLFNVNLTAFSKNVSGGFYGKGIFNITDVPVYTITEERTGQKPLYAPTGEYNREFSFYVQYSNSLITENYGLELLLSTIKIKAIQTSFNLSSTLYFSRSYNSDTEAKAPKDEHLDKYALIGVYRDAHSENLKAISTLSTSHHISKLGLLINFRTQFFWDEWSKQSLSSAYPLGFYTSSGEFKSIAEEEQNNADYAHLIRGTGRTSTFQPIVYTNYHLKLSKEIHRLARLSIYVNNFLNHRPRVFSSSRNVVGELNEAPSFGIEFRLTIK
ncbi:MAG: TonB-dependent receptor [Cyclobacteriaceae bacterium]